VEILKKLPVLTLAFLSFFLFHQAVQAETGLQKVSGSVYSYTDIKEASPKNSFGANTGIIVGKDYLVAVDSLISAREAKRFIKDIKKVSKKPVKFLINTHYHLDHSLGNSEFAKLGAVIIAHENDQENMQKAGEGMLQYAKQMGLSAQDLKGTKLAYPTLTFGDRVTLYLGNNKVEILFVFFYKILNQGVCRFEPAAFQCAVKFYFREKYIAQNKFIDCILDCFINIISHLGVGDRYLCTTRAVAFSVRLFFMK